MTINKNDIKELNSIVDRIRKSEISNAEKKVNELIYTISNERKNKKISQTDLATMTGLPQTTISRIETFVSTPTLPVLIRILSALDMDVKIVHR